MVPPRRRLAARQGHADGQYGLGVMYGLGNGVEENPAEAVSWLRRTADQGHVVAALAAEILEGELAR